MNLDALQTAIYSKLTGDTDVMAIAQSVSVDVEQPANPEDESAFPFITLGRDDATPWDTKTNFGVTALCQIDIWSRSNNFLEAKQLASAIWTALHHRPLAIANADHVMTVLESTSYSDDPDGHTKRGMLIFRVTYDNIT